MPAGRERTSGGRIRARRAVIGVACVVAAALHGGAVDAEIFKCKGPGGRVLYGDSPCPGGGGEVLTLDENPPAPPGAPPAANRNPELPVVSPRMRPEAPRAPVRYELSANERQRIVSLEQVQRSGDNSEKREAARMEIDEIRRGVLARMSFEDRRRKDGYWTDLDNIDRRRRIVAVEQLADLFAAAWQ